MLMLRRGLVKAADPTYLSYLHPGWPGATPYRSQDVARLLASHHPDRVYSHATYRTSTTPERCAS
jgi:hypothetical protein